MDAIEVMIQLLAEGGASIVSFNMNEEDIQRLMRQPWTTTASDGAVVVMGEGVPHPRSYGTFPRQMTGYMVERGLVHEGMVHVLVDGQFTIRDRELAGARDGAVLRRGGGE